MDKQIKRTLKLAAQTDPEARMLLRKLHNAERNRPAPLISPPESGFIDCACLIHGSLYTWDYVDRLYNMLTRNTSLSVRLHVYTEPERAVPEPFVKHCLADWQISGPKKSWWYKMQLFNQEHFAGNLLYFDLDVVITANIDWIWQLSTQYFWTVRDFKYLWRPTSYSVNSSVMWWNTQQYHSVYEDFAKKDLSAILKKYRGDQDYISDFIQPERRRFFETDRVASWRWQAFDGGYDFVNRMYRTPGTGTLLGRRNSVLIFHGQPKPENLQDPVVLQHWK
jgi:hypothetical protein